MKLAKPSNESGLFRVTTRQPTFSEGLRAFADWDSTGWNVAYSDGSNEQVALESFLETGRFAHCKLLLVGSPHLIPSDSVTGQLYTRTQLERWRPGCPVRTFDDQRARLINGGRKSSDAIAYRDLAAIDPSFERNARIWSLQARKGTAPYEVRNAIREDASARVIAARNVGYEPTEQGEWGALMVLFRYMDTPSPECARFFGLERRKNSLRFKKSAKRARVMAVYATTFEKGGVLRRRPDGGFIGVNTVVDGVIGMSWSRVPNVMRSNLVHHGMRPMLRERFPDLKAKQFEDEAEANEWWGSPEGQAQRERRGEILRSSEARATKAEVKRCVREMVRLLRDAGEHRAAKYVQVDSNQNSSDNIHTNGSASLI